MNSKGTENVALRGNAGGGGAAAQRGTERDNGLGSERGLATPSPDGTGERISALSLSIMRLDP
jgi:hypothetical protein